MILVGSRNRPTGALSVGWDTGKQALCQRMRNGNVRAVILPPIVLGYQLLHPAAAQKVDNQLLVAHFLAASK